MGQTSIRETSRGHQSIISDRRIHSVRLDSWKEIASYLHRDARTVRRWERERRLPVHRVPGGERSGVFAYVSELEHWLSAPEENLAPSSPAKLVVIADTSVISSDDEAIVAGPEAKAVDEALPGPDPGDAVEVNSIIVVPVSTSEPGPHDKTVDTSVTAAPKPCAAGQAPSFPQAPLQESLSAQLHAAAQQSASSRWALCGMALMLLFFIVAGTTFACVHYRRFHRADVTNTSPNPEAQELYLRGRYSWNLRTEAGLNQAVDLFTQSIVTDPHYAPAYAGLADSYLLLRQYGPMPDSEAYPRALAAARQSVLLDPDCPDAHRSIAFILRFWNWDMAAAEREYLRAIELDPKNSQSHHWYATALLSSGRFDEALFQINLARALEPQSVSVLADRGFILSFKDAERGIEALKQVTQSQPEFSSAHQYLSEIYLDSGDYAGFLAEATAAATLPHDAEKIASLSQARKDLADRGPTSMLDELATRYAALAEHSLTSPYLTARLFGFAGDSAGAVRYLKIAYECHDPGFLNVDRDRAFQNIRSSQEYVTLLARRDTMPGGRRQPLAQLHRIASF